MGPGQEPGAPRGQDLPGFLGTKKAQGPRRFSLDRTNNHDQYLLRLLSCPAALTDTLTGSAVGPQVGSLLRAAERKWQGWNSTPAREHLSSGGVGVGVGGEGLPQGALPARTKAEDRVLRHLSPGIHAGSSDLAATAVLETKEPPGPPLPADRSFWGFGHCLA